jgi:outer membrane protein assembly factor BamB
LCVLPLAAADWPQWRGPERNGTSKETGLLKSWPKTGPELLWMSKAAGTGYSSPAVVGGKVYVPGARGGTELVIALDDKGKELWTAKIGPVYDFGSNTWVNGPDAAPLVDGELLFALGSQGILVCLGTADGKERWRKDLPREMAAEINPVGGGPEKMGWGFAWSPLVDGDRLIITPGGPQGLFAALDKKTGAVLWRSKGVPDQATYASPMPADIGGVRQYVTIVQSGVVAVSARDGSLLWEYRRDPKYPDVVCTTPLVQGDLVYASVGWNGGATLLKVSAEGGKFKAEPVYANREIGNKQGGVVLVGGHVYGFHEDRAWMCQDFRTGAVKWESTRRGLKAGSVIAADGNLYCLAEDTGDVALLAASPDKYAENGRFRLPKQSDQRKVRGKVWTHPVLSDGKLYLRDQELLFCYKVK